MLDVIIKLFDLLNNLFSLWIAKLFFFLFSVHINPLNIYYLIKLSYFNNYNLIYLIFFFIFKNYNILIYNLEYLFNLSFTL